MAVALRTRINEEYATLLDSFSNLMKSLEVSQDQAAGGQTKVPGELLEVFATRCLHACHSLLAIMRELKRNALLNDMSGRNAQVAAATEEQERQAAALHAQFQALQAQIQAAQQLVPAATS